MSKVFGYPKFDEAGEMILTTYDGDYAAMLMDVRIYKMKAGETRSFCRSGEEIAVLLLSGAVTFRFEGQEHAATRKDVFTEGPWCVHAAGGVEIGVTAGAETEILVQCTKNEKNFPSRLYKPEDAPWKHTCAGKFGNVANRRVNTIFDHDICPESNMVLGEVLNDRGNWSGYLPHQHPQPETYFFLFDRPEGFGASFVGDEVFKSVDHSFSAIPGGKLHPQSVAPGFQMYTAWMIRHLDGNPWLQTDRCEDERYVWLHDAKF
ncbi:MAG: 5-deoxy-glucuronate isomerase [Oscillibacter sp.]|jgi:5-deoxy-glucuronate isomerase|nr:5-deoxy-glucuronate isomerase [Oscillibacter sp.]